MPSHSYCHVSPGLALTIPRRQTSKQKFSTQTSIFATIPSEQADTSLNVRV